MIKNNSLLFLVIIFSSCSLYVDNEMPDIHFEYSDFDILELGRTFSDMAITEDGKSLFLADYNNNAILQVNTDGPLSLKNTTVVGSHPIALDLNSDNSRIAVALEGESKIALLNTNNMNVVNFYTISLMNVNDLIFINDSILIISSKTDPACITLNVHSSEESSQSVLNGELAMDLNNHILYVATSSSVKKYNWDGERFYQDSNISDPYGFVGNVHHMVYNPETDIVFSCISDKDKENDVQHVYSYRCTDMTFAGKYLIRSPGLAVAVSENGERVFTAPTDADEIGVFIIEFDQETKLESNYYLSAGNLTGRGLSIDKQGQYLYSLVNIPGDDDSFEPYNDFSFDLQRIAILD